MATGNRLENDETLECHFKWKPDIGGNRIKIPEFVKKLLRDLKEKISDRIQTYSLVGYLSSLDPYNNNSTDINSSFKDALKEAGDAEDKSFIAEANLVMYKIESGNSIGTTEERKRELQEKWSKWERGDRQKLAFTHGCHAHALSKFGPNKVKFAIEQFGKAMELDPENWVWVFGKAKMLERDRTLNKRKMEPSKETLDLFDKAVPLSESDPYVLVCYANCLIGSYYSDNKNKVFLRKKITNLLKDAENKAILTESVTIIRWCCKGYKHMKWYKEWTDCYQRAEHFPHEDSGFYHWGAKFFMNPPNKNLKKAKELLVKSITFSPSGNLFAAIDLIKVRIFLNEGIDIDEEYGHLFRKCKEVEHDQAVIHENWGISLLKLEEERLLDAVVHFKKAIRLYDSSGVTNEKAWIRLVSINEDVIKNLDSNGKITPMQAYKDLAWMYFVPEPKSKDNLNKADRYLSRLKEGEFEEVDIELYGKILYVRGQYLKALDQFEKLEGSHEKKCEYKGKCFFQLANQTLSIRDKKDKLLRSIQNGCLDGCKMLLQVLHKKKPDEERYHFCGIIKNCLDNPKRFVLQKNITIEFITNEVENVLGMTCIPQLKDHKELEAIFLVIRRDLLTLYSQETRGKDSIDIEIVRRVLSESRKSLDHLQHKLLQKLYPHSKDKVYFPHLDEEWCNTFEMENANKNQPGGKNAKSWTLSQIRGQFWGQFKHKNANCFGLIKQISELMPYADPTRYWLYDAWNVVNYDKHQGYLVNMKFKIPGSPRRINYADLAKNLAFFAEEMREAYCKVIL